MFHSQLAIHWSDAIKQLDDQPDYKGAYPVRALKKLGYEVQVRAVCDLMYRNLGPLNFGDSHILATITRASRGHHAGITRASRGHHAGIKVKPT